MIIAITIIAIVIMKIAATAPPIMTAVLSERLWGLEAVVLSVIMTLYNSCALVVGTLGVIMTLYNSCALVVGTLGVGVTLGLSDWGSGVPITPGGRVTEQVRVTVSPATMNKEGEEMREMRAGTVHGCMEIYIMKKP